MSNHDNQAQTAIKGPGKGPAIVAAFGAIAGVVMLVSLFMPAKTEDAATVASATAPVAAADATQNIAPVATVEVEQAAIIKVSLSGEEMVKNNCAMCHAAGMMNAPKIGDKAQWAPRIAQGYETIVKHAIEGIRSMPARGGNPAYTDFEMARAVVHMANASGAKFEEPKESAAEIAPADGAPAESTPAEAAPAT